MLISFAYDTVQGRTTNVLENSKNKNLEKWTGNTTHPRQAMKAKLRDKGMTLQEKINNTN